MTESLGARLKAERERKRVTLETIAERTKIRQALFEGLERDDVSRWPGGLFRRSYFRSYAGAIGLDPESAMREFLALFPEPVEELPAGTPADESEAAGAPKTRLHYLLASAIGAVSKPFDKERSGHVAAESAPAADHARAEYARHDTAGSTVNGSGGVAPVEIVETVETVETVEIVSHLDAEFDDEPEFESHESVEEVGPVVRVDLDALASLCTRIAQAGNVSDLEAILGETARILDAVGIIVWPWDPARGVLVPSLVHGYPRQTLSRLPTVPPDADNPVGAAFRTSARQVVAGGGSATSAIVVPLTTPRGGCDGVLAVEFANGLEQDAAVQALATILAAQLSLAVQHVRAEPASRHAIA